MPDRCPTRLDLGRIRYVKTRKPSGASGIGSVASPSMLKVAPPVVNLESSILVHACRFSIAYVPAQTGRSREENIAISRMCQLSYWAFNWSGWSL